MITFRCPHCGSEMEVDESFAGRPARCPTCGTNLKVPAEGQSPAATTPGAPPPGAARVTVGGESVEVVPPLETMVIVSTICVGLSMAVFLAAGLTKFVTPPWAVGGLLGALLALLGIIVAVPAYHSVRRSKGRKRGRSHALIAMAAGTTLFLVFVVIAMVGFAKDIWLRPTCEENLKHIYTALRQHARDHGGTFPDSLETLVGEGYLESDHWLTCPAHKMPVGQNTYILTPDINIRARHPDGQPFWPPDTMIVSDGRPTAHRDGRVRVLLLSGEVTFIPTDDWYSYRKAQTERWRRTLDEIQRLQPDTDAKEDSP